MRTVIVDEAYANMGQTTEIFNNPQRTIIGMVGEHGLGVELQDLLNGFLNLEQRYQDAINKINVLQEKVDNFDNTKGLIKIGQLVEVDASISDMTAFMGYGSWELFGRGRMTICSGSITEGEVTHLFLVSQTGGEVEHAITIPELPDHDHVLDFGFGADVGDRNKKYFPNMPTLETTSKTKKTGEGKKHNNMSPYVVVQRWKRVG